MVATAIEHALAMSLVLIAIVSSTVAMVQINHFGMSLAVEGDVANAYTVEQALFTHLGGSNNPNRIDIDKLDELSATYELAVPSLFKTYGTLVTELGLEDAEFHLWITGGLDASAIWANATVSIEVLQPFSRDGVAAQLVAYVFDGVKVRETLVGETNAQGRAVLQPTEDGVVIVFASQGASVGFAYVNGTVMGAADSFGVYVRNGQLLPQERRPQSYFIFSKDGYTGPVSTGAVNVAGYALPAAIAWMDTGNIIHLLAYPHFPVDYGAPTSKTAITLTTIVIVERSIMKVKLQVWGSGGTFH